MWLIGREWKCSDVRSGPVLIDRGLDLSREPVLKESETTRKTERIAYSESQEKRKTGNSRTERMKIRSRAANKAGRHVKKERFLYSCQGTTLTKKFSGDSCGDPPVPMPNTAVKPANAESTWGEAPWEDRKPLIREKALAYASAFFV